MVFKYLALGAGIQSSALAEMMVEGELPPVDIVIFADTKDEPQYVYAQVEYLERLASIGVPLEIVIEGKGIIENILDPQDRFASIPAYTKDSLGNVGMMKRQCTSEFKIKPIERRIVEILVDAGKARRDTLGRIVVKRKAHLATCLQGISLDESQRMSTNKRPWIKNSYPLIDKRMTRLDCVKWLEDRKLPIPKKSSCLICPYHSNAYWHNLSKDPEAWAHVTHIDNFLREDNKFTAGMRGDLFLSREAIPLETLDFTLDAQSDFFDLCEGYCFI